MSWTDMVGGLVQSVTHQPETTEQEPGEQGKAEGGLLGSVLGTAFSSLDGAQLAEKVNSVTGFLSPELKANLVGSALDKIGVSGGAARSLLEQLGINPAVADNPEEATPEEMARLAEHLQTNEEEPEFAAEATDQQEAQADESGDETESEDNSDEREAGNDADDNER